MTAPAFDSTLPERGSGAMRTAFDAAMRSLARMPFMIISGWVAAIVAAWLVTEPVTTWSPDRIAIAAGLGIPLFFALAMFAEQHSDRRGVRLLIQASGLVPLSIIAWRWPSWPDVQLIVRFLQLALIFHLTASVLPWLGSGARQGFWQYNKTLLIRAMTTGVWAVVLFAALALAIGALDVLFGVKAEPHRYGQLWFVVSLGFSVWFFAAGLPVSLHTFERDDDYPRSLRYFVQYLLVPIVVVYLCILTAYLGKVRITREWPSGWIGWLVSSVSAVGMLCWLLLQPLIGREAHGTAFRWVRPFSRGFFFAIVPAIGMLLAALSQRIAQYGLTEPRVALFALSVWFAGVALFYLVTRSRNIVVVPASLAVVAVATLVGPLSLATLSRNSQMERIEVVLREANLLVGDSLVVATGALSGDQRTALRNGLNYMYSRHGTRSLPWPLLAEVDSAVVSRLVASVETPDGLPRTGGPRMVVDAEQLSALRRTNEAMRRLGVPDRDQPRGANAGQRRVFTYEPRDVNIAGYALQMPVQVWYRMPEDTSAIGPSVRWNSTRTAPEVFVNGARVAIIPSAELLRSFAAGTRRPARPFELTFDDERGNPCLLVVHSITVGLVAGGERLESLVGDVYLRAESVRPPEPSPF